MTSADDSPGLRADGKRFNHKPKRDYCDRLMFPPDPIFDEALARISAGHGEEDDEDIAIVTAGIAERARIVRERRPREKVGHQIIPVETTIIDRRDFPWVGKAKEFI